MKRSFGFLVRRWKDLRLWNFYDKSLMDTSQIPSDFKEFLKLLNENEVEYVLIGGYAVNYYGYVRPTGDMDIFIGMNQINAKKTVSALKQFGFDSYELNAELFLKDKSIVRMGVPPMRLEISNYIDGVSFERCYDEREIIKIDELNVNLISLENLKATKKASGRYKDLNDLENLP
jgi:predicted nucleotidyltransferase